MMSGGTIDQNEIKESLEGIEHAEQQLAEVEDFDAKLEEQKKADEIAEKEREIKRKLENKAAPHLTNLHEDFMISQKTYYPLKDCKYIIFVLLIIISFQSLYESVAVMMFRCRR